mgnify:CR=1 FL=1
MSLEKIINDAWENKDQVNQNSDQNLKDAINQVIADLDSGKSRVAEKINGEWVTHQHLKKAIMLSFRIYPMENLNGPYSSCLLYTSPSPRDGLLSRMPSSA